MKHDLLIRVLKVPFRVFDKLKNEIQKIYEWILFLPQHGKQNSNNQLLFHVKIDFTLNF